MIIIIIFITLLVDLLHYRSIITLPVDYYITGRLLQYWLYQSTGNVIKNDEDDYDDD